MERVGKVEKDVRNALKLYLYNGTEAIGLSVNNFVKMTGVPFFTIYSKSERVETKHISVLM
jgi:hypothetical protein